MFLFISGGEAGSEGIENVTEEKTGCDMLNENHAYSLVVVYRGNCPIQI
jgi:hypothetical protein